MIESLKRNVHVWLFRGATHFVSATSDDFSLLIPCSRRSPKYIGELLTSAVDVPHSAVIAWSKNPYPSRDFKLTRASNPNQVEPRVEPRATSYAKPSRAANRELNRAESRAKSSRAASRKLSRAEPRAAS
ncbi:hypothetical protein E6C27_scaffold80G002840 [Cucumis melo var. makuwa]|uniref:Uncharacterized protein n=1 Tax=Cucumis melo var. makuwa TaxID=1194695 RepID=A0A5A7UPE9_CUCMM|nr:hypothetical protein E6C27_scaffold80G002840 [Cucumis melo var. makuwa]